MQRLDIPFNIDLLIPDEKMLGMLRQVKSLDTFTGSTKNFNTDGLYSNETFGAVGTASRSTRFGFIDIKVPIIHPTIFKALIKLKGWYKDLIAGREFATWDDKLGDFVKCNVLEGRTGYQFFFEHFRDLKFITNDSIMRQQYIAMFDKYKKNCTIDKVLVLPAGLRDLEIDENGRATSDEVNELYFKMVAISNTINLSGVRVSIESYNPQRVSLQNTLMEIYDYFTKIVEGKKNLFMGKWASRKVFNTTRNVITAMNTESKHLDYPGNIDFNDSLVGLYQTSKAILPITIHQLKKKFLNRAFTMPGSPALLTNRKTLESERVMLKSETYNQWLSNEGLEKFITYFQEESIRHAPIIVESNYYLGLTYLGPDGTFAICSGIDELPPDYDSKYCHPTTYAELLYHAIYDVANKYPMFITRYPIAGIGSIYPSMIHLKTTVRSEARRELDPDTWEPMDNSHVAYEFPIIGSGFYNSLSPHSSKLVGLGADFDGDTVSGNAVYTDEGIKEVKDFMNSKRAYVGSNGKFLSNTGVDTIKYVLGFVTGRKKFTEPAA